MWETWLDGLGDTFPEDYVFAGAVVVYNASVAAPPEKNVSPVPTIPVLVSTWSDSEKYLDQQIAAAGFQVQAKQNSEDAGNLFYRLVIPADMGHIADVKATMDGAVVSAGFGLRASNGFFISNPRRDGQQPATQGPGKVFDPAAGNIDTHGGGGTILGTAGEFWGQQLFGGLASKLGMDVKTVSYGVLILGGIILVTSMTRR